MNKKLLVLAASSEQIETITTGKRLGYYIITLDNRPSNPGHALADLSYDIDTTDWEGVLEVARRENIQGIIAACTDIAVPTAAYVAHEMHLKGPPLASSQIMCSKVQFRNFLSNRNFAVPAHVPFGTGFVPDGSLFQGTRWILKPNQSSGSKGVFIVDSKSEFLRRADETLSFSPDGQGILEQFIDGFQGTCEGFLKEGQMAPAFILDRHTADPPYVATTGHSLPSSLSPNLQQMLLNDLTRIWKILGIGDGPFDCDFVATDDTVYLLEISPRMGGNSISNLLQTALGFDIVECSIRHALDEDVILPLDLPMKPSAVVIFGVPNGGRLRYNRRQCDELIREPWVHTLSFDIEWNNPVRPFVNSRERIGYAIVAGRDRADVDSKVDELKRRLSLRAEDE
jgi:biotin carboxylase